jgi:putative FmdB family regulatory protein
VPTYQYTCTECAEPLEVVQKFTDAPLAECVACGGRLRKVFSPVGIVFKGSGFYRTDSRNGSSSAASVTKEKTSGDSSSESSESSSTSSNGSADKAATTKAAEPAKSSAASEKVA